MDERLLALGEIIKNDMKPAFGVTEPGAIAYASAVAKKAVGGTVQSVRVALNSGIYKNSFTCGIPNSRHRGCDYAAALGAVGGDPALGLEGLSAIGEVHDQLAEALVKEGKVEAVLQSISSTIHIKADVTTENGTGTCLIEGTHTNIKEVLKNGEPVFTESSATAESKGASAKIRDYTLADFYEYAKNVDIKALDFLDPAFEMNMALFNEGYDQKLIPIVSVIIEKNGDKIFGKGPQNAARILTCGAIEARVAGASKPAMSVAGSGSHGIITVMPVYAAAFEMKKSIEEAKRAAVLSCLVTVYIKEYSGRLSALCGCTMASGTGTAIGLVYLTGGGVSEMTAALNNMASSLTGMICHGGNPGCVLKSIIGVDTAFLCYELAMNGQSVECCHGILANTPEATMQNIGVIASPGMSETEGYIVDIMAKNK